MFVLNVTTDTENVDVNVTPDKLQMFIRNEPILMAILKSSLQSMYSRLYKTMNVENTSIQSPKSSAIMVSFFKPPQKDNHVSNLGTCDDRQDENKQPNENKCSELKKEINEKLKDVEKRALEQNNLNLFQACINKSSPEKVNILL